MPEAGAPPRRIRVLLADDSAFFREVLAELLAREPGFEVVATASDGEEVAARVRAVRPDVITMDLAMPRVDGFAAIQRVMADAPTPILVLTATPAASVTFRALSLGALDILEKPRAGADLDRYGELLRSRLRLLAGVPALRHRRRGGAAARAADRARGGRRLVVVGASLGGPRALASLLRALPRDFPAPIAVVQHIADGFAESLASWLAQDARRDVRVARDGDRLDAGRVLLAPSGSHLVVDGGVARRSDAPAIDTFKPSVTPLFSSAARAFGADACGVLLTGMGRDGAAGMRELRDAGAYTIAQDEATSAVYGMPRAAVELGAVDRVLPLGEIPAALAELTR